jgi:hypothetical protein
MPILLLAQSIAIKIAHKHLDLLETKFPLSYLVEAPDSGQNDTVLECLHIVSVPLYHSRVLRSLVHSIIVCFKLQDSLRKVFQFHGCFTLCASYGDFRGGRHAWVD